MSAISERIRDYRRDRRWNREWEDYCTMHRLPKDPRAHPPSSLRRALEELPPPIDEEHAELVDEVKRRQADKAWLEKWRQYCRDNADGTMDPNRHSISFLRQALRHLSGSPPSRGGYVSRDSGRGRRGGGPGVPEDLSGTGDWRGRSEHDKLVDEVKRLQKDKEDGRTVWADFCKMHSNGTMDPKLHSIEFLTEAIKELKSDKGPEFQELVEKVKENQKRRFSHWSNKWARYCEIHSDGTRNPASHSLSFLKKALDDLGEMTPEKLEEHQKLVDEVKKKQKEDPVWKTRWVDYCSDLGEGTRDPEHHDITFLKRALRDLSPVDAPNRLGLRKAATDHEALVARVKENQMEIRWRNRWMEYCDTHSNGFYDPNYHDAGFLRRALRFLSPDQGVVARNRRLEEIQRLAEARRSAQHERGFDRADKIREILWEMGVDVNDSHKTWRSDDGLQGSFKETEGRR